MKRLVALFGVMLLCAALLVPASAAKKTVYPKAQSNFFVNDFADCLDAQDEAEMQQLGEQLYKATGAQVVVVTVLSLDGESIEDYGYGLANEWGIGDDDADSGVLLLLSTGDREVRIEVGKGLEGCLPDGKTGRILDSYAIPYLRENAFSEGLLQAYKVLVNEVYIEYGIEVSDYTPVEEEPAYTNTPSTIFLPLLIFIILVLIFGRFGGYRHRRYYGGTFGGGSFGGGSFGGGHSSGGFHGGGGSFGGGGSSRGF